VNRIYLLVVFLISFSAAQAQLLDSIKGHLQNKKPKFSIKFDNRNSFVSSTNARIIGIKIGWEYNELVKLGIGYNFLVSNIRKEKIIVGQNSEFDTVVSLLKFEYLSPYFEYVFFKTKRWEHSIPVQIGIGNIRYEHRDDKGRIRYENYKPIILYEPAMTTQFKVFPWFGLAAGVGYRLAYYNKRGQTENFTSPIYLFRVKIFLGEMYRSTKKIFISDIKNE
jgi:hypothetical protein